MPHCHLLIILDEQDKPRSIEEIDSIVCAEIPDPLTEPQLYKTVTTCMNHGLCGPLNPNAKCMENGKCTKHYPKQFRDVTSTENDGYPIYRRRNDGRSFISSRNEIINNTHIVPYNKVLSHMFDCHINTEICNSISACKYIYKYIYKGKFHVY